MSALLLTALRQYRHNNGEGFVFGYDMEETDRIVAELIEDRNQQYTTTQPAVQGELVGWVWQSYNQTNFTSGSHHKEVLEADGVKLTPVYTSSQPTPAAKGEPVGWYTEDHLHDKSATTYSAEVAQRWRDKGWPVWPLYSVLQLSPDVAKLVEALEQGFPLLSDDGLDEVEHHCEWVIQRERKRVHSILAAHRNQQPSTKCPGAGCTDQGCPAHYANDYPTTPEIAKLVEALEEIIHPVRFMQERLEEGEQLNGMVAVQLAEDASYLRDIAIAALEAYRKQGGDL